MLRDTSYQISLIEGADPAEWGFDEPNFDPLEWGPEFSFDPSEWGSEFIFCPSEWGIGPSNKDVEGWQMKPIMEILKHELQGTSLRVIVNYILPKGHGNLDGLIVHELEDGTDEVIASIELNNFGPNSWIADVRNLNRWNSLEDLAERDIIKLHPNYKRFHLLCGGHRFQYCLHPEENGYIQFRFPKMIGPIPRRTQLRFLRRVAKELKKTAMSVLYPPEPNVCYNGIELLDIDKLGGLRAGGALNTTIHSTQTTDFWRFEGWKLASFAQNSHLAVFGDSRPAGKFADRK